MQTLLLKDVKKFEVDLQNAATSELESLKYELKSKGDASIEQLKSRLQQAALEHQVRFSKLHEKRAQVIDDVYQLLVDLQTGYAQFLLVDRYEHDPEKLLEGRNKINKSMVDAAIVIEKHRIYLPKDVCASLKAFVENMMRNASDVGIYANIGNYATTETVKERQAVFEAAYEALQRDFPIARAALETEFRSLLDPAG